MFAAPKLESYTMKEKKKRKKKESAGISRVDKIQAET